jgi:hypothetical protein
MPGELDPLPGQAKRRQKNMTRFPLSKLVAAAAAGALLAAAPVGIQASAGGLSLLPAAAQAKNGADDGAGHVRRGRGADDKPGHVRRGRGADDKPGHVRHGRGGDDKPGHVRPGRGTDD